MLRRTAYLLLGAGTLLGMAGCGDCNRQQGSTVTNDFTRLGPAGEYRFPTPPSTNPDIANYSLRFVDDSTATLTFQSGGKEYVLRYQVSADGEYVVEKRHYAE